MLTAEMELFSRAPVRETSAENIDYAWAGQRIKFAAVSFQTEVEEIDDQFQTRLQKQRVALISLTRLLIQNICKQIIFAAVAPSTK